MANDPVVNLWKRYDGRDDRRSTRVKCDLPLLVYGQDSCGEKFVERTQVIDLNLHGCGFRSRHSCLPGSYVTLRFAGDSSQSQDKIVRAQVKRSDPQLDSNRWLTIGVELGIPGNVWSYAPVPMDWLLLLGSTTAQEPSPVPSHTPVLVTREQPVPMTLASSPIASLPGDEPVEIQLELASAAPALPEVLAPIPATDQIDAAVEPPISRGVTNPAAGLDSLLDQRLADIRATWDVQLDGYLVRMEECVQRMERHAALAEQKLTAAQALVDKTLQDFSRQLEDQIQYALNRATQVITQKAALSVDRELLRLTEDAHFVAREANAMIESDSAKARAETERTLHSLLEELRARSEEQSRLLAADTRQKVASALAAMEAEHLARLDHRMKSTDHEFAQAGAKVSAEFRHSLRAFFHSCLVAAVGAVEEHSQATLDSLSSGPDRPPLQKS